MMNILACYLLVQYIIFRSTLLYALQFFLVIVRRERKFLLSGYYNQYGGRLILQFNVVTLVTQS
jgi:hypothetical protein